MVTWLTASPGAEAQLEQAVLTEHSVLFRLSQEQSSENPKDASPSPGLELISSAQAPRSLSELSLKENPLHPQSSRQGDRIQQNGLQWPQGE
jgi:hypothetical protein